jgi:hypothetical protein
MEEGKHERMRLSHGKATEIPSFANALSGMEEGALKLAAQAVACGNNKIGW